MRKLIIMLLLGLLLIGASSCAYFSDEITGWQSMGEEETSLEEAGKFIGKAIPAPTYLPKDYKIQEVFIGRNYKRPLNSRIHLHISDKEIEKRLTTYTDAGGTQQRYEFKCKMMISMWWTERWGPGLPPCDPSKRNCKIVNVREWKGWFDDQHIHRTLWFWPYGPRPGFEIALSASKRVPEKELIKVAESFSCIKE